MTDQSVVDTPEPQTIAGSLRGFAAFMLSDSFDNSEADRCMVAKKFEMAADEIERLRELIAPFAHVVRYNLAKLVTRPEDGVSVQLDVTEEEAQAIREQFPTATVDEWHWPKTLLSMDRVRVKHWLALHEPTTYPETNT